MLSAMGEHSGENSDQECMQIDEITCTVVFSILLTTCAAYRKRYLPASSAKRAPHPAQTSPVSVQSGPSQSHYPNVRVREKRASLDEYTTLEGTNAH